jgi:hypothetical protein
VGRAGWRAGGRVPALVSEVDSLIIPPTGWTGGGVRALSQCSESVRVSRARRGGAAWAALGQPGLETAERE